LQVIYDILIFTSSREDFDIFFQLLRGPGPPGPPFQSVPSGGPDELEKKSMGVI
jgi:hypothetical protein